MRAVQIAEFGPADRLVLGDLVQPRPGPGELLVRLAAASVNRADVLLRAGRYHTLPALPATPGSEGAGIVEALGDGVEGFAIGDQVVAWGGTGFYAEYALADQLRTVRVPAGVSLDAAAALPVAWLSAWYALTQLGRVQKGDVVLIYAAASGVGSAAVQIAKRAGALVIGVVGLQDKAAFVRELGADHV
jgi:NADPH2:quinone reductase